jgi:hypothetical protein
MVIVVGRVAAKCGRVAVVETGTGGVVEVREERS